MKTQVIQTQVIKFTNLIYNTNLAAFWQYKEYFLMFTRGTLCLFPSSAWHF